MADQPSGTTGRPVGRLLPNWYPALSAFRHASRLKSIWQILNTLVPYGILWYLMLLSINRGYPYFVTLALALPAAGFLVRLFIFFHDCVHSSFFKSRKANTVIGHFLGVLVFTAFEDWRFSHLRHHGNFANLDARGHGDIWTMTRREYEHAPLAKRLQYRFYRNPVILIFFGAMSIFLLANRFPTHGAKRKEQKSVWITNLLIVTLLLVAIWMMGWRTYLLIQLPVLWLAGVAGIWLFYVQHQFSKGYWARKTEWHPLRAAMEGSSFYNLPSLLRWFSGSIGYHHVHHLSPKIPNYRLKQCFDAIPALQEITPLLFWKSLACARLKLWDEEQHEMVAFS